MSKKRCAWCQGKPLYEEYHDTEWGVPLYEDQKLFEFLSLELFQAGLSWITVLKKRPHFRIAFDNFKIERVAQYSQKKIEYLMQDKGIIRNRLKIEACIANAAAIQIIQQKHPSFAHYLWSFVDHKPLYGGYHSLEEVPAYTPLAQRLSQALKKEGFRFIGPRVCYAFMQATGLVNDHLSSCFRHRELKEQL